MMPFGCSCFLRDGDERGPRIELLDITGLGTFCARVVVIVTTRSRESHPKHTRLRSRESWKPLFAGRKLHIERMMSIRLFALFPLAAMAFKCGPSVPAATCLSLASAFSQLKQFPVPTSTIGTEYLPPWAVAPRPFSPATFAPVVSVSDWTPAESQPNISPGTPSPIVSDRTPAAEAQPNITPGTFSLISEWSQAEALPSITPGTFSPIVSYWTPAGAVPIITPAPAPIQPKPSSVPPVSQWSTCLYSKPWTCQDLLCTSLAGTCTAWVQGDGPPRDLCFDGKPTRCEGSECTSEEDADDDTNVCDGWSDPKPTPAWGTILPPVTPQWGSDPYLAFPTGYLGGGSGFMTVTMTGSDFGAVGGTIDK
jgi:hypothetical protein